MNGERPQLVRHDGVPMAAQVVTYHPFIDCYSWIDCIGREHSRRATWFEVTDFGPVCWRAIVNELERRVRDWWVPDGGC
jgi:hypothetical protein